MTVGGTLGRFLLSAHRNGIRTPGGFSIYTATDALPSCRAAFGTSSSSSSSTSCSGPVPDVQQSNQLSQIAQLLSNSSENVADTAAAAARSIAAAQPFEPLAQFWNPTVLGSSIWELAHSATGLPWWASIPLTTFALRTVLLPLTLKAKSAALNWVLLQNSFQTANNLLEQLQLQQQKAPVTSTADQNAQGKQQVQTQQLKKPTKLKLVRMYYRYFRKQHKTTSMWWWLVNAGVQANLFIILSVALRQMADSQWPGMGTEGLGWFTDLTQPSVLLHTLQCPYGVAGSLMPVGMLFLYLKTVEKAAVRSPRLTLLLQIGSLPYFIFSCLVPQATQLYWMGNQVFFFGMQAALQNPKVAKAAGLPTLMLPMPSGVQEERERAEQEAADARQLICGSEDDGFLRFLAANYMSRGQHQQALQCLQRLTVLAPGDVAAFSALGRTAAELQQWPAAAAAYERAAELAAATGEVEEQAKELGMAGKHWLNAVAECRQLQKTAATAKDKGSKGGSKSSSQGSVDCKAGDAGSTVASASKSEKATSRVIDVHKQQDYIDAALRTLEAAVVLPAEAAVEARYLLAMAYTAAGQRDTALSTSQSYWSATCDAAAAGDVAAKSNAAAKLLPVLANLCKQYHGASEDEALMNAANLAVEVARAGWDRQSQEQLYEVLGAAAQAASALGRYGYAEQLKQLKQKLGNGSMAPSHQKKAK